MFGQWNWQPAVGAVFVAVGAFAFYVSAFISGRNLYRDHQPAVATLVSGGVGVVVFLFSPACFMLLDFTLFGDAFSSCPAPCAGNALCCDVATRSEIDGYLARLLPLGFFYVVSIIGVGLTFGALTTMGARAGLLDWARKRMGLDFGIRTYVEAWESLLSRVKPGGFIQLDTEEGKLSGTLRSHSVAPEPREISVVGAIDGHVSLPHWIRWRSREVQLITPACDVRHVNVPPSSLKKHQDVLGHGAQALFTGGCGAGMACLSFSADHTGDFLITSGYGSLGRLYLCLALTFLLLALMALATGFYLLHGEHQRFRAAFALEPACLWLLTLALVAVWVEALHIVGTRFVSGLSTAPPRAIIDAVVLCVAVAWLLFHTGRWLRISKLVGELQRTVSDRDLWAKLVDWLYLGFNLQAEPEAEFQRLKAEAAAAILQDPRPDAPERPRLEGFFSQFQGFMDENSYLAGEYFSVIRHLSGFPGHERHQPRTYARSTR